MAATKRTIRKTVKKTAKRTAAKAVKRVSKVPTVRSARKSASHRTARVNAATLKNNSRGSKPSDTTRSKKTPAKRSNGKPARDALTVLRQDHRDVEKLFKRFEKAGHEAHHAKGELVASMIEALSRHAEIEELVFYPALRQQLPRSESAVLEALEEHHLVKIALKELESLDPSAKRFDAKATVMIELVRHHVKEEEAVLFPKVRDRVGRRQLLTMGDELRTAKPRVPTRPHPGAPDEPPANGVAGSAVAVIDRVRNVGRRAVERVREEIPSL
jgi:hemerythrin-like domain-containing protein